jgi:hypothetical protein
MARGLAATDSVTTTTLPTTAISNWSMAIWVNFASLTGSSNQGIITNGVLGGDGYSIYMNPAGSNLQAIYNNVGVFGTFAPSAGIWYHFCLTRDTVTGTFYVNGSVNATDASHTPSTPTTSFGVGKINQAGPIASVADAAFWTVSLSASEVLALSNGARSNTVRPLSLKLFWPLGGFQSPEPDLSGNKNNGTLTGTNPAFGPPLMQLTPRWPQFNPSLPAFTLMPQAIIQM